MYICTYVYVCAYESIKTKDLYIQKVLEDYKLL